MAIVSQYWLKFFGSQWAEISKMNPNSGKYVPKQIQNQSLIAPKTVGSQLETCQNSILTRKSPKYNFKLLQVI